MKTYSGGCHCGDVRFEVDADLATEELLDCNCSICTKKGLVHMMVPPARFRLLTPASALTTYTFNTHVAKHTFCARCGIHAFYTPRCHPDHVDVNVRCLDEIDVAMQSATAAGQDVTIARFDGRHWEESVAAIRRDQG